MTPEFRLLLAMSAEARGLPLRDCYSSETATSIDESKLATLADRHQVCGEVTRQLRGRPGTVSERGLRLLESRALVRRLRVERLVQAWPIVTGTLERAGIDALLFKGPALSVQLYGSPFAREYSDLDVLADLQRRELGRLISVLGPLGYRLQVPVDVDGPGGALLRRQRHDQFKMVHRSTGVILEVHCQDLGSFQKLYTASMPELLERSDDIYWNGERIGTFGVPDHAFCVIAHGAKHAWASLQWLVDAGAILAGKWDVDWTALLQRFTELGLDRALFSSLQLITSVFDLPNPIPRCAVGASDRTVSRCLAGYARSKLQSDSHGFRNVYARITHLAIYLPRLKRGPAYTLASLLRLFVPTASDLEMVRLPGSVGFLYWLLRPVLVVLRWMGCSSSRASAWRAVSGRSRNRTSASTLP